MPRKPLIAANWKMNKNIQESISFINNFKDLSKKIKDVDIVICPPFTSLNEVNKIIKGSNIKIGAQNMHYEDNGAFTGEISPLMLKDAGCDYIILGHSERREYFNEDNQLINKKLISALKNNISPILCIGEKLEQRENNPTFDVIKGQLTNCLKNINEANAKKITIAYEPCWAIGTGKTASPQQAEEVHKFIRELLSKLYNNSIAENTRIIYGGSVKPNNIKDLMNQDNIDGALVGGASLNEEDFFQICNYSD